MNTDQSAAAISAVGLTTPAEAYNQPRRRHSQPSGFWQSKVVIRFAIVARNKCVAAKDGEHSNASIKKGENNGTDSGTSDCS
jgi:hypothetical protein